jgi:protein-S-isoprenylcysteine O-methyltransferase Ste14
VVIIVSAVISIVEGEYILSLALFGLILLVLGMYVNFVARRDLAKHWSPLADSGEDQKLIKTGIYAKIRHPIYLSAILFSLGVVFTGGNLYGFVFFLLLLIALGMRIRKEERELITKFGEEYKEYAEKTAILVPKLKGK